MTNGSKNAEKSISLAVHVSQHRMRLWVRLHGDCALISLHLSMHKFATFVADDVQIRSDMVALRKACARQGVALVRPHKGSIYHDEAVVEGDVKGGRFVVTNQAEALYIPIQQ